MWDLLQYRSENLAFRSFLQGSSKNTRACRVRAEILTSKTVLNIRWRSFLEYLNTWSRAKELAAGSWGAVFCGNPLSLLCSLRSGKRDLKDMTSPKGVAEPRSLRRRAWPWTKVIAKKNKIKSWLSKQAGRPIRFGAFKIVKKVISLLFADAQYDWIKAKVKITSCDELRNWSYKQSCYWWWFAQSTQLYKLTDWSGVNYIQGHVQR